MAARPLGIDLPFVIVEWMDAWQDSTNDASLSEARAGHKPVRCFDAGWLLLDDDEGVQLASAVSPTEPLPYRKRSMIPRAMIVDVHHVSLARKPRRKAASTPSPDQSGQ